MYRLSVLVLVGALGCQTTPELPPRSGIFSVGDHTLALSCSGGTPPRIVIDAGLGESSASWQEVTRRLNGLSVCTFDRAGYGDSSAGPEPRTPQRNAEDLARLIGAAHLDLEGPIILVGHSIGGLNALAFWRAFPELVAGMILLDPPPRAWLAGERFHGLWDMAEAAGAELQAQSAAADPLSPQGRLIAAMASEHMGMLQEGAAVSAIASFGDLPVLVIAAGRANPAFGDSASVYQAFWIGESESLAARSSRGGFVRLDRTGHNMNAENPEAVADLIRDFATGVLSPGQGPAGRSESSGMGS